MHNHPFIDGCENFLPHPPPPTTPPLNKETEEVSVKQIPGVKLHFLFPRNLQIISGEVCAARMCARYEVSHLVADHALSEASGICSQSSGVSGPSV